MDQFSRTRQLLGDCWMEKIQQSTVAVFGLGAVGSFVTEALARTGVGNLHLIDFDQVDVSNINRQLFALHSTVGQNKADIACQRVKDIYPQCNVVTHSSFVNADSLETLLSPDFDVVVDAIDGLNSKVNLIVEARRMNLAVVSSMGAGGRVDISKIKACDISQTSVCPLARVVRQRLHRRGLYKGVMAVYSTEKPLNKQPFRVEDTVDVLVDHGRKRVPIGTVSWVPGAFGLMIASQVVNLLTA